MGERVNVHHKKYTGMAWDAPDEDLITLCNEHHRIIHSTLIKDKKLDATHISNILKSYHV